MKTGPPSSGAVFQMTSLHLVICVGQWSASGAGPGDLEDQEVAHRKMKPGRWLQSTTCSNNAFSAVAPLARCMACAAPKLNPCIYDLSQCYSLPPGSTCELRCRDPYVGEPTIGYCSSSNTVFNNPLQYTLPSCSFSTCIDPPEWPEGYKKDLLTGFWECAPGYGGEPVRTCSLGPAPQCGNRFATLSGCLLLQQCILSQELKRSCQLDLGDCHNVPAGETCVVKCKVPYYAGSSVIGRCKEGNTNPSQVLSIPEPPDCELLCPQEFDPPPAGYEYFNGAYRCELGYTGVPRILCEMNLFCQPSFGLDGCVELVPCAPLGLQDSCEFDTTDCNREVPAANSCDLFCKFPYRGVSGSGQCPTINTARNQPLEVTFPQCLPVCADPEDPPIEYRFGVPPGENFVRWHCAPGYAGIVQRTCTVNSTCGQNLTFSGCKPVQPCKPPAVDQPCKVDISDCENGISPNGTCIVRCRNREPIFVGSDVVARCPHNNTDPDGRAVWEKGPPICFTRVEDCDLIPEGYMKIASGWECAPGYSGRAKVGFVNCDDTPVLSGCKLLSHCSDLILDQGGYNCSHDASSCVGLFAGDSCEIRCRSPAFTGNSTIVYCPADNTDPSYDMPYTLPECTLVCVDPSPAPEGYTLSATGWECAYGFWGNVSTRCELGDNCSNGFNLTGCEPLADCDPLGFISERLNTSDCDNVMSGESCEIRCQDPFDGTPTLAFCPKGVLFSGEALQFTEPICRLECDTVPAGYVKTEDGWKCSLGYTGPALQSCAITGRCDSDVSLSGCALQQPCKRPVVDSCIHDVSDCRGLQPGSTCTVHCVSPYEGMNTTLSCPSDNTDRLQEPLGALPDCVFFSCPDPTYFPEEYVAGSPPWSCAPGYGGIPEKVCTTTPEPECAPQEANLTGCGRIVGCAQLENMIPCELDISNCSSVSAGFTCEAPCQAPYVPASKGASVAIARCPNSNVDPAKVPDWDVKPACVLSCPDPHPTPPGYVRTRAPSVEGWLQDDVQLGWQCAPGYYGEAEATCEVSFPACESRLRLTGCEQMFPCVPLNVSDCGVNMSGCQNVAPGESCKITCRQGYSVVFTGNLSTSGYCPANNTDPMQKLELVFTEDNPDGLPNCTFVECVGLPPKGYTKIRGDWECVDGYTGNASGDCTVDTDCSFAYNLDGCMKFEPCLRMNLSDCEYDVPACPNFLQPGSDCKVYCNTPTYLPLVSIPPRDYDLVGRLSCPSDNTDPSTFAVPFLPTCAPNCTERVSVDLTCPPGYVTNSSSYCMVDEDCELKYQIDGCAAVPPCKDLIADICMFDTADCYGVAPGTSCQVSCVEPYRGKNSTLRCPMLESLEPQSLEPLPLPPCFLVCQDPDPVPPGYRKISPLVVLPDDEFLSSGETRDDDVRAAVEVWECADGYVSDGPLQAKCIVEEGPCDGNETVTAHLSLSGCTKLQPCRAPQVWEVCDNFRQPHCACNISHECGYVMGGESCTISCTSPYVGTGSALASCPDQNTDPGRQLVLQSPLNCDITCPLPENHYGYEQPDQYVATFFRTGCPNHKWSDYYIGRWTPHPLCQLANHIGDNCLHVTNIWLEMYEICTNTEQGIGSADDWVQCCGEDYENCPVWNTAPIGQVPPFGKTNKCEYQNQWSAALITDWFCNKSHTGVANAFCATNETCAPKLILEGCFNLQGCIRPDKRVFDYCRYDASKCPDPMSAGESCEITCRPPYVRIDSEEPNATIETFTAFCPSTNEDPTTRWKIPALPNCAFFCTDPDPPVPGYTKVGNEWQCTFPTHVGVAKMDCFSQNLYYIETDTLECQTVPTLSGCQETLPCRAPLLGGCEYDTSDCDNTPSASSCQLRCKYPFAGPPVIAHCPAGNLLPDKVVQFADVPNCIIQCPVPEREFLPDGYNYTDAETNEYPSWSRRRSWTCAIGYHTPDGFVNETCKLDTDIMGVILPTCEPILELVGCFPLQPCGPLDLCKVAAPCVDTNCPIKSGDLCDPPKSIDHILPFPLLLAGQSCEVRCRPPCKDPNLPDGIISRKTFSCPYDNVVEGAPLQGTMPNCFFNCDPIPSGYERVLDKWRCADGYTDGISFGFGKVEETCVPGEVCATELGLSGCAKLVPCSPPPHVDICKFDMLACTGLARGSSCKITCRAPYSGSESTGQCGLYNTNPYGLRFKAPSCSYDTCPDPTYIPEGYAIDARGWTCAEGYAGTVRRTCGTEDDYPVCTPVAKLSGCLPFAGCSKPEPLPWFPEQFRMFPPPNRNGNAWVYEDPCEIDFSDCTGLGPGDNCTVNCTGPFVPAQLGYAECPESNTDTSNPPMYDLPKCTLTCPQPDPLPHGYEEVDICADYDVRLVGERSINGDGLSLGIPEVFIGGGWHPICSFDFEDNDYGAGIVCRQLGYSSGRVVHKDFDGNPVRIHHYGVDGIYIGGCFPDDILQGDSLSNCLTDMERADGLKHGTIGAQGCRANDGDSTFVTIQCSGSAVRRVSCNEVPPTVHFEFKAVNSLLNNMANSGTATTIVAYLQGADDVLYWGPSTYFARGLFGNGLLLAGEYIKMSGEVAQIDHYPRNNFVIAMWMRLTLPPSNHSSKDLCLVDIFYNTYPKPTSGIGLFMNFQRLKGCFVAKQEGGSLVEHCVEYEKSVADPLLQWNESLPQMFVGRWVHVAMMRQGTELSLFLNGNLAASKEISDGRVAYDSLYVNLGTLSVRIGRTSVSQSTDPLSALIDDFRIYNAEKDIASIYSGEAARARATADGRPASCEASFSEMDGDILDMVIVTGAASRVLDDLCCQKCLANSECEFWVREAGPAGPTQCWLKKNPRNEQYFDDRRGGWRHMGGCMWRQLEDSCTSTAEPAGDKSCSESIPPNASGYCDCNGNNVKDTGEIEYVVSPQTCGLQRPFPFFLPLSYIANPNLSHRQKIPFTCNAACQTQYYSMEYGDWECGIGGPITTELGCKHAIQTLGLESASCVQRGIGPPGCMYRWKREAGVPCIDWSFNGQPLANHGSIDWAPICFKFPTQAAYVDTPRWYYNAASSYEDFAALCQSKGMDLCTYDAVCPSGPNENPFGGKQNTIGMWAPIVNKNGWGTQDWVQVGEPSIDVNLKEPCTVLSSFQAIRSWVVPWAFNNVPQLYKGAYSCCPNVSVERPSLAPAQVPPVQGPDLRCGPLHAGDTYKQCLLNKECSSKMVLLGCLPLMPCEPLNLTGRGVDACEFLTEEKCEYLQAGQSCEIHCRDSMTYLDQTWHGFPFAGSSTVAVCVPNMTSGESHLEYTLPTCTFGCPTTGFPIPDGYVEVGDAQSSNYNFRCIYEEDWTGEALTPCLLKDFIETCVPDLTTTITTATTTTSFTESTTTSTSGTTTTATTVTTSSVTTTTATTTTITTTSATTTTSDWRLTSSVTTTTSQTTTTTTSATTTTVTTATTTTTSVTTTSGCYNVRDYCISAYDFEGCAKRTRCAPPDPRTIDTCMYDVSLCGAQNPGETCSVSCRDPFVGSSIGSGTCFVNNTKDFESLRYDLPPCTLVCPEPPDPPEGYVPSPTSNSGWECAPGFALDENMNEVIKNCTTGSFYSEFIKDNVCSLEVKLFGCKPLVNCSAPVVDQCGVDISRCLSVPAGGECLVSCTLPTFKLAGEPTTGHCPAMNTNSSYPVQYHAPLCHFTSNCEERYDEPPLGYAANADKSDYICTPDYMGTPTKTCVLNENTCGPGLVLQGCEFRSPCRGPEVEKCGVDASNCSFLFAGKKCEIKCIPGYVGRSTIGDCPIDNRNLANGLQWSFPSCEFQGCVFPEHPPPGYVQTDFPVPAENSSLYAVGDNISDLYSCAVGYVGSPSVRCNECDAQLIFSGCTELLPCYIGNWTTPNETCPVIDMSGCPADGLLKAGEFCVVRCSAAYKGIQVVARCPHDNVILNADVPQEPPFCTKDCPAPPDALMNGYKRIQQATNDQRRLNLAGAGVSNTTTTSTTATTATTVTTTTTSTTRTTGTTTTKTTKTTITTTTTSTTNGWLCSDLYVGNVEASCEIDDNCSAMELNLTGCIPKTACADLEYNFCRFEAADCQGIFAGDTCKVNCASPRIGSSEHLMCPDSNSDPRTPLIGNLPYCNLPTCVDSVPEGYMKTAKGWSCAPGYSGEAIVACGDECCDSTVKLSGCKLIVPCFLPHQIDTCMHDIDSCLSPVESCTITCRKPYIRESGYWGRPTTATCPAGNQDPNLMYLFRLPRCELTCPDLEPSEIDRGYQRSSDGTWRCDAAANFIGIATATCEIDSSCTSRYRLHGCDEVIPCVSPSSADPCQFNSSSCGSQRAPGETCNIHCVAPYIGNETVASCSVTNLDQFGLQYEWPACTLTCPDPPELPVGYERVSNVTWRCADGYAGEVLRTCVINATDCKSKAEFAGCALIVPCVQLIVPDPCMVDASGCDEVEAGEDCTMWCKPPFTGPPKGAYCPVDNVDPNKELDLPLLLPQCSCKDPKPVPEGYVKTPVGWQCSSGFTGTVIVNCQGSGASCLEMTELSGCIPALACEVGPVKDISIDRDVVSGILPFGPAQTGNVINEVEVLNYRIYFADNCGEPIGTSIGTVPRSADPIITSCCLGGVYEFILNRIAVPAGAGQLVVIAVTALGEAPVGRGTPLFDFVDSPQPYTAVRDTLSTGAAARITAFSDIGRRLMLLVATLFPCVII